MAVKIRNLVGMHKFIINCQLSITCAEHSRSINFPKRLTIKIIDIYQSTLSPDHGPLKHLYTYGYCRHEPTCSEYGKKVIKDKGVIIGSLLTLKRILGCNPWKKPDQKRIQKCIDNAG